MGLLGIPGRLECPAPVAGRYPHARGHLLEGAAHVLHLAGVAHLAGDNAQVLIAKGALHHIGRRLELRAEAGAMVARGIARHEHGVAATDKARHMPDEHLRRQAALVHRQALALVGDGLVGGVAHYDGAADALEERRPQHAEPVEQKRPRNAHHADVGPICRLGHENLLTREAPRRRRTFQSIVHLNTGKTAREHAPTGSTETAGRGWDRIRRSSTTWRDRIRPRSLAARSPAGRPGPVRR